MARKLTVEILGDASSLNKALGNATDHSSRLGSALKTLGKVAAVGAGAAFAGLAVAVKNGFDELSEGQQVSKQTEARLKSTGQAANVTAKEVENLAQAQSRLTGIDDEAVQAGENMLLTFTNIRNEVGKGNDIFNQSTIAVENMATAMADGAVPSAEQLSKTAIRVGKALNDPVKGMGALSRVGVQFDADQQKLIKTMVKAGDTMGAQKLILAELTKEFGGSAKAAGDTLPGQLAKARNAFDEVSARLATKLLPILTDFLEWVNAHWPEISAVFDAVGSAIVTAFDGVSRAVDAVRGQIDTVKQAGAGLFSFYDEHKTVFIVSAAAIGSVFAFAEAYAALRAAIIAATVAQGFLNAATLTNPYVAVAAGIFALVGALTALYFSSDRARKIMNDTFNDLRAAAQTILPYIQGAWQRFGASFIAIGEAIFKTVTLGFRNMLDALHGIVNIFAGVFTGDWRRAWRGVEQVFDAVIGNLLGVVRAWVGALGTVARQAGAAIVQGVLTGLAKLRSAVATKLGEVQSAIASAVAGAYGAAVRVGQAMINGVLDGLAGLFNAVKNKVEGILKSALGALNPFSSVEEGGRKYIGAPIVDGAVKGVTDGKTRLESSVAKTVRDAVIKANDAVTAARGNFASAFQSLASEALAAFDAVVSAWRPPAALKLEKLQAKEQLAQLKQDIRDGAAGVREAQAELATAMAGGDPEQIKAAQDKILEAQRTSIAAQNALRDYNLQQQADKQQKAHDEEAARDRIALQRQLDQLQAYLNKHPDEYAKVHAKINALLAKQGVDQEFYGTAAGIMFANGLRKSEGAVVAALLQILKAVEKRMKLRSNAEEGPLSDLDTWWAGFGPTLAAGIKGDAIYGRIDDIFATAKRKSDDLMGVIGTAAPAAPIEAVATSQGDITTALNTGLQERVKLETDDNAARIVRQATWDAQELVAVQTQMRLVLGAYRAGQNAILAMFDKYMKAYYERGVEIGQRLADGLWDMRGAVRDAAQALADEITRALGVASQAAKSATDATVNQLRGQRERLGGMAAGGIVTKPTLTWIGERGPEAVIPLSQMGGSSPTYVFQFPNYVGDRQDLIDEVRRGLYEVSRRNPGAIPGVA